MKRILTVLFLSLFILTGCAPNADGSSTPGSTSSPVQSGDTQGTPENDPPPTPVEPGWQDAYLTVLNTLCETYGRYVTSGDSELISGVKYARLLDFNGDGVRELVVLFDRTVQLYTCRDTQAELLYEGTVGARYGQTDVSYTFHVNALSSTPSITLFHSENEWWKEAITIIHLTAGGDVVQTELFAATDGANDIPDREALVSFQINGQDVSAEDYNATRSTALDDSTEIDVDWGAFPATEDQLALVLRMLEYQGKDEGCFILPNSDAAYLSEADVTRLTARELRLARNEIYARHGRAFGAADLKAHFSHQGWYQALYTPETFDPISTDLMNKYEVANLSLILAVESSGSYNQNAADLTAEEALSIAEAYWNCVDGSLDSETGYLLAISADDPVVAGGRSYYIFRLRSLVDNDHWATQDLIYVDAQTGATTSTLTE